LVVLSSIAIFLRSGWSIGSVQDRMKMTIDEIDSIIGDESLLPEGVQSIAAFQPAQSVEVFDSAYASLLEHVQLPGGLSIKRSRSAEMVLSTLANRMYNKSACREKARQPRRTRGCMNVCSSIR